MRKKKSSGVYNWEKAPDIKNKIVKIVNLSNIDWIKLPQIYCIRSQFSKAHAYARIWGLPKVWQLTLNKKPSYIIEVISEKFDNLSENEKDKVLLHELAHIPKNFSGSLIPHIRKRGERNFNDKVKGFFDAYFKNSN